MSRQTATVLLIILTLIAGAMQLAGCTETPRPVYHTGHANQDISSILPTGADNIEHIGNGWYTFDVMNGTGAGCYLINMTMRGNKGYGMITWRPCG